MSNELTAERLREVLHYDPETGAFTWREKIADKVVVGQRAGSAYGNGYRGIRLFGVKVSEQRLAHLYMTGTLPGGEVDHRNRIRSDNRWDNLRPATHEQNHQNRGAKSSNPTGLAGVSWHKLRRRWRASIGINGKQTHLGLFDTPETAHAAYLEAKARLHTFNPTLSSTTRTT